VNSPVPSNSIIGPVFGSAHRWWMRKPRAAGIVAFACYLVVALISMQMHIWSKFRYTPTKCVAVMSAPPSAGVSTNPASVTSADSTLADGFSIWNWGVLYSFSMPLAAFLMALYFRALDDALLSLDDIIKPSEGSQKAFTTFLEERLRTQWSSAIFPISLGLSVLLTLAADGRDIIAPIQSGVILPSCTRDWSNVGYTLSSIPAPWYFGFNCLAFSLQVFLGYCGILLLVLTGVVFSNVFKYGLGSRLIIEAFRTPGSEPPPPKYYPDWIWCNVRCGLEHLDLVFAMFTGLSLFALVASATSIFVNVYLRHHPTPGSIVLALGTMFFIPWSAFWIFVPYFSNFPKSLPADFKPTKSTCDPPNPWPFGNEKLSWILITITTGFWLFLLMSLVRAVFSIPQ
jgi:hypothetical protein